MTRNEETPRRKPPIEGRNATPNPNPPAPIVQCATGQSPTTAPTNNTSVARRGHVTTAPRQEPRRPSPRIPNRLACPLSSNYETGRRAVPVVGSACGETITEPYHETSRKKSITSTCEARPNVHGRRLRPGEPATPTRVVHGASDGWRAHCTAPFEGFVVWEARFVPNGAARRRWPCFVPPMFPSDVRDALLARFAAGGTEGCIRECLLEAGMQGGLAR